MEKGLSLHELRQVTFFADLTDEELQWLMQHGELRQFAVGSQVVLQNAPAEFMVVLLQGTLEFRVAGNPQGFRTEAGAITGLLPFSRMTHFGGTGWASSDLRALFVHKDHFMPMLSAIPTLGPRLVGLLTDRVRNFSQQEMRQEKLASLGKLSAGLAHELNNPAAAAARAASQVTGLLLELERSSARLGALMGEAGLEKLIDRLAGLKPQPLSPLDRSEREDELADWLQEQGLNQPYEFAATLVEVGADLAWMQGLKQLKDQVVPQQAMPEVVVWLHTTLRSRALLRVIEDSSARISALVKAIKSYSYMDQAAKQEVSLQEGLENTLALFSYKLKSGINVQRDYAANLPKISAFGAELNQVWTNLIDNAIDAMQGQGTLRLRTAQDGPELLVEIADSGPGIPPELQSRIFEPFFTTKEVGKGTGLGLETVRRIVQHHGGSIRLESSPGHTCFQVRLPL